LKIRRNMPPAASAHRQSGYSQMATQEMSAANQRRQIHRCSSSCTTDLTGPFRRAWQRTVKWLKACGSIVLLAHLLMAEQVPVRHAEGRIHGFLVLRDLDDNILASGELTQLANGNRVSTELRFHFKDGSIQEETAVFSQRRTFQLLTYRLVQKGRAFQRPIDMSLNTSTGQVIVRYADDEGKEKTITDRLKLPADLANGIVTTLLSDIDPKAPKTTLSMLVATPRPRLVKLEVSPTGEDSFSIGGVAAKAMVYTVKVDIGGISGVIAPIIGKQPPDTHIWMIGGSAPGFLKSEGPLYQGSPVLRIELAGPVWPKNDSGQKP
jgi:hypothetical protein